MFPEVSPTNTKRVTSVILALCGVRRNGTGGAVARDPCSVIRGKTERQPGLAVPLGVRPEGSLPPVFS